MGDDVRIQVRRGFDYRWAKCPEDLLDHSISQVSANGCRLWGLLERRADANQRAEGVSRRELARRVGVSVDTLDRAIVELEDKGWLSVLRQVLVKGQSNLVNVYTLMVPEAIAARMTPSRTHAASPSREGAATPSRTHAAGTTETGEPEKTQPLAAPVCLRHRELDEAEQRALSRLPSAHRIPVVLVFGAWCSSALDGAPRSARLNATVGSASTRRNRADLISDRLDAGWPLMDLVDAVQGWRESPHHRGVNATETVYDDLALCLRDGAHIEKFRDLWRARPAARLSHLSTGEVAEEERRRHAAEVDDFWRREREREQAASGGRR